MTPDHVKELRAPFADQDVGKLPRVTCPACSKKNCQQHKKATCKTCGAYISEKHIHLDYVGHAAVTNRLLAVDPDWNWEPLAFTDDGLPAVDKNAGMWIKLTVCGVTRLGYGHPDGKAGGDAIKETIGDAIRNAAMRFGVAIDLWHKGTLSGAVYPTGDTYDDTPARQLRTVEPVADDEPDKPRQPTVIRRAAKAVTHDWSKPATGDAPAEHNATGDTQLVTAQQIRLMSSLMNGKGLDEDEIDALILEASASRTTSRKELTRTEASTLIERLKTSA